MTIRGFTPRYPITGPRAEEIATGIGVPLKAGSKVQVEKDGRIMVRYPGTQYPILAGQAEGGPLDGAKAWAAGGVMKALDLIL